MLTLILIITISVVEFGVVNLVIDGLNTVSFWIAILFDTASLTFPGVYVGIYSSWDTTRCQIIATIPLILTIFLSTTFSPGSGVPVLKELRFLFPRFYFWCITPGVDYLMEGCPKTERLSMLYLCLSAFLGFAICLLVRTGSAVRYRLRRKATKKSRVGITDQSLEKLKEQLYGRAHFTVRSDEELFGQVCI